MAAEGKSTNWGTIADLSTTPVYAGYTAAMLDAGAGANITPEGTINGQGTTGTMGHFCVLDMMVAQKQTGQNHLIFQLMEILL